LNLSPWKWTLKIPAAELLRRALNLEWAAILAEMDADAAGSGTSEESANEFVVGLSSNFNDFVSLVEIATFTT
jgi:hypothetical protein